MTLAEEAQILRTRLNDLASNPEWSVLVRYELPQKPPTDWYPRIKKRVKRALRVLGLSRTLYLKQPWNVGLKHVHCASEKRTLLIWSEGHDCQFVRDACEGMRQLLAGHTDFLPILVTDIADFAFFSRLGWLVEYLPELGNEGVTYRERKRRYLAWRYRDALAVPLSAGLASPTEWDELLSLGRR